MLYFILEADPKDEEHFENWEPPSTAGGKGGGGDIRQGMVKGPRSGRETRKMALFIAGKGNGKIHLSPYRRERRKRERLRRNESIGWG